MAPLPLDPDDIDALLRRVAELKAAKQAEAASTAIGNASIETQGGAAVQGSVTAGGHFIGRDFVQIVRQCTAGAQEAGDAKSAIAGYLDTLCKDGRPADESIQAGEVSPAPPPESE